MPTRQRKQATGAAHVPIPALQDHRNGIVNSNAERKQKSALASSATLTALILSLLVGLSYVLVNYVTSGSKEQRDNIRGRIKQINARNAAMQDTRRRPDRFPKRGTVEFSQQCGWTRTAPRNGRQESDCAYFVRPPPGTHEGISAWLCQISEGYMSATLNGCQMLLDYGDDVDIFEVLTPFPDLIPGPDAHLNNWTVPANYLERNPCGNRVMCRSGNFTGAASDPVPRYRFAYKGIGHNKLYKDSNPALREHLPGLQLDTGMACALGNLLHLSPAASKFEPQLFTNILPALHDENAIVMALYIRSGFADVSANKEKEGQVAVEKHGQKDSFAENFAACAMSLEKEYLTGGLEPELDFSRIVWMIVTDSQEVKMYLTNKYNDTDANEGIISDEKKWPSRVVSRKVVTTSSSGAHTRPERNVSTADFAGAMIDWYLLGETDLVIVDKTSSFGPTGALRTARPLHRFEIGCPKDILVHEPEKKTDEHFKS